MTGKICVSIAAATPAEVASAAAAAASADVIEVRLDALASRVSIDDFAAAGNGGRELLFTNRPPWEGGGFSGSEEERTAPLIEAAGRGFWADIELSAPEASRRAVIGAAAPDARVIVSWHDFSSTPDPRELSAILARMAESGAHVGKIVTTAHGPNDVLRVLSLLEEAAARDFPLIAFCMGEAGRISRVATLFLGGFMSYVAPDEGGGATAPGQLTLSAMRRIIGEMA